MRHDVKRVALYLRVSTQDQSCEIQRDELTAYAQSRGWQIVAIHEDKSTGTSSDRRGFKELMKQARTREIDLVLCYKLDRFARSLKDLITTLHELSELGVEFVSHGDNIDLSTSAGRLMVHIIGAMAEFEAALIRDRVVAGLAKAKEKGVRLGRPKRNMDIQIQVLREKGLTYRQIQKQLKVSHGTIRRALQKQGSNGHSER